LITLLKRHPGVGDVTGWEAGDNAWGAAPLETLLFSSFEAGG